MSDLQQRNYYRIFSGTNQADGNENIYLGYGAQTTEITFPRDKETYFHVPFFTAVTNLTASTLLADGAEPGVIPAGSDRIFKKQGNYGTYTNWGHNTGIQDGTWLCSWFRSISGEEAQWYDRYYDPSIISYEQALNSSSTYVTKLTAHDPAFADIPSRMNLEPGVLYYYHHMGEVSSQQFVDTFAGDDNSKLRLDIDSYKANITDASIYKNTGVIRNFKPTWSVYNTDANYITGQNLDFNNTDFIDARVYYSNTYNLSDRFTFNLFVKHTDWVNATSSQLAGNLFESGYGLFYNNLNYYPYFVIPENTYGHIFFYNQEQNAFLDQSTQPTTTTPSNPIQVSLNGERDIFVLDSAGTGNGGIRNTITKYNHVGDVIASVHFNNSEEAKQFIIDKNNNVTVFTTAACYVYDKNLSNQVIQANNAYTNKQQIAYDICGNLRIESNCDKLLFDNSGNKWNIVNGYIFKNDSFQQTLPLSSTNLAIDPNNNLWILYGGNHVKVINVNTLNVINQFDVGEINNTSNTFSNISFINTYNRNNNTTTWNALIYYNFNKTLYTVTLNGIITNSVFLTTALNSLYTSQDKTELTFTGGGDFTGYEWSRINNRVLYNNTPQIQFKVAISNPLRINNPTFIHTVSVPVPYFVNNTWYLITGVYENHSIKLYIDNTLRDSLQLPVNMDITYKRKNDLIIGCPTGKSTNLNLEINSKALIFNGQIDTLRIYDYEIPANQIQYFLRSRIIGQDLTWNIPTAELQYIETIERFFKHKMPGAKSQFFNIKLSGTGVKDPNTRAIIENTIRTLVQQTKPAYTELLSIEWV